MRVGALAVLLSTTAFAHAHLVEPSARETTDGGQAFANKVGPCGPHPRSPKPHVFSPGQTITVRWTETIQHPGYYEINFALKDDAGFAPLSLTDGGLANRIPNPPGLTTMQSERVVLPNINCSECLIQLIQVMTENPQQPSNYYSCADIVLTGAPDGGDPNADAGVVDAGAGGGAGGGGGGDGTGGGTGAGGGGGEATGGGGGEATGGGGGEATVAGGGGQDAKPKDEGFIGGCGASATGGAVGGFLCLLLYLGVTRRR